MLLGAFFCAVLLRASIVRVLLFCRSSVCYSTVMLLDFIPCFRVSRGSQLTSNWLGEKPVVMFAKLLWTRVVMASQLLQSI